MTATHATRRLSRTAIALLASVVGAGFFLGGCVATDEYDGAREANRTLEVRIAELTQQNEAYREALGARDGSDEELRLQNAALRQERSKLSDDITALRERINRVNAGLGQIMSSGLDPKTDADLRRLAARYDVMSYDPATGRIAFASDLTFPSGSDTVRDAAKQTLNDFARILGTSTGGNYLIYIEGHTDSQKPSNPNTLKKHPTNRHLSAHRAISVGNVLKSQGVSENRIFTGGWGAARPAVQNNANGNTPQNRRVEIYLVANKGNSAPAPASSDSSSSQPNTAESQTPRRDAPMK